MPLSLKAVQKASQGLTSLKTVEVEVPEWRGKALLRELTGMDMDRFQGAAINPETRQLDMKLLMERRGRLVQASVIDADSGRKMFETEKLFIEYIETLSKASLEALGDAAMKLNGLDEGKENPES